MRISDWSSDVCSSDLPPPRDGEMMLNLQTVPGLFRRSNGQQESNVSGLLDTNIGNKALQITQRFTLQPRADSDILHGPPKIMIGCFVEGSTALGGQGDQRGALKEVITIGRAWRRKKGC